MRTVTWSEVRARRLARSSLARRSAAESLVDVVRAVGGVHAQVQASAELQLGARVDGITRADVREALWERRALVKAWSLRGTLHLHAADELALWHAAARAHAPTAAEELEAWRDPAGVLHPAVAAEEARAIRAAVWDVLHGRCLLREEIAAEVGARVGGVAGQRLESGFGFFLGDLCQGPPRGTKVTLVRPDQWIAGWGEVDPDDALAEVCRRFVRAYGPAQPRHFREWFGGRGLSEAEARALFESLVDELEEVDVEGSRAYVLAGDADFADAAPPLRLLSEYDVYVMGFREREHLVPEPVRAQIAAHGRGRYEGPAGVRLLLVDGVAAGLWERKAGSKRVDLTVRPVRALTRVERAQLDDEAARIGAFLGLEPALTVE